VVYGGRVKHLGLVLPVLVGAILGACGGAPEPRASAPESLGVSAQLPAAPTAASVPDDCQEQPGKPAPDPLERTYTGVAAKARCQREVFTIMGGVTHFLGVSCGYCHLVPDYRAMTHRKEIANWMASDLIPALQKKKNGKEPWCNSCHTGPDGKGVAKILGDPRRPTFAVEWMTTHLVEDFQTKNGSPLHCKSCHQGNLGTPEFQRQIILTNHLPTDEL
jgi:hypothetical protein